MGKSTPEVKATSKPTIRFHKSILFWTIVAAAGTWVGAISVVGGAFFINETVQDAYNKASILVLIPPTNSTVSDSVILFGHSNMRGFNHYIVVSDVPLRKHYVQDGPVPVAASGLWSQPVPFGDPGKNCGTQFDIIVVATHKRMKIGVLDDWSTLPADGGYSQPVAVTKAC